MVVAESSGALVSLHLAVNKGMCCTLWMCQKTERVGRGQLLSENRQIDKNQTGEKKKK